MQKFTTGRGILILLSKREAEVLCGVCAGLANKEIAGRLSIGTGTVKTHISHLMSALALDNRTQLATWAIGHPAALAGEAVSFDRRQSPIDRAA